MNKSQMIQGFGSEDWINGAENHSGRKNEEDWGNSIGVEDRVKINGTALGEVERMGLIEVERLVEIKGRLRAVVG